MIPVHEIPPFLRNAMSESLQYSYRRLSLHDREIIASGYLRHLKACRQYGIDVDNQWLPEAIGTARLKGSGRSQLRGVARV